MTCRWDIDLIDQLPQEYMKVVYGTLLNVYSEMEEEVAKEGRSFAIDYGKGAVSN